MKKRSLLLAVLSLGLLLTGCGQTTSVLNSEVLSSTAASSETVSADNSSSEVSEIDYVHNGSVLLGIDYTGRDFYKDGIGEVTLKTAIDGDTAHFTPKVTSTSSAAIKARFYGIDTPESTGSVEPWGKKASDFTKEKLKAAKTIVVQAPATENTKYAAPEFDSTGSRYVSMIWISDKENCPYNELICLNLWIVQEGYSMLKGVDQFPMFQKTFEEANDQARALSLHMWGGDDPDYNNGDYTETSILDIKKEVEKQIADPTYANPYDNRRVRLQGTVAGFANNILYLEGRFDAEHGGRSEMFAPGEDAEYAGINVFTGMNSIPSKFTTKGNYIEICGLALDSENFGFQITSVSFARLATSDSDARVLFTAADNDEYPLKTFEFAASGIDTSDLWYLNCPVSLTSNVKVTGGYISDDHFATLYIANASTGQSLDYVLYLPFLYKPDTSSSTIWSSIDDFKGKTFRVSSGIYGYHKSAKGNISYQIIASSSSDVSVVE